MPLGKLAMEFKKLSQDKILGNKLVSIAKLRNKVAHAGYVISFDELIDDSLLKPRLAELKLISSDAEKLRTQVLEELRKVEQASPDQIGGVKPKPKLLQIVSE